MNTFRRAIALVDLNAFFASIEQLDFPELRGRAVAVTNGLAGTCIITCSYEARQFGIKTGMRIYEARKKCPLLVQCGSRPQRYAEISARIMHRLMEVTPDMEIFSVDEAFLDITKTQYLHGGIEATGQLIKQIIFDETGLLCSVGISGDKTTAKFAAKLQKPNGLTIIKPQDAESRLEHVPVTELCGIAQGIGNYLAKHGVLYCGQMKNIPEQVLTRRFGHPGRRIWLMAQGKDPAPVQQESAVPKSIGHGKVLPPKTSDKKIIENYLRHMSEKVAKRLRVNGLKAQTFWVGLKTAAGFVGDKHKTVMPCNDGHAIYLVAENVLKALWAGDFVYQVQVTALDPNAGPVQLDLFAEGKDVDEKNKIIDLINQEFGNHTLTTAAMMNRLSMPDVIAPAWRPEGVRSSI